MDIGISFEDGIPVLALEGRLDAEGATQFDEQVSALHTDAVQWVIDLSGVGYLSSLGIRSLVALEQRLRARDGGLVLASLTPLVQKVLHLSRLDDVLRIVPTAAAAIEIARATAAAHPTIEMALSRCRAKVRRLQGTESMVEWWSSATSAGSIEQMLSINASDLGIAFGIGNLGGVAGAAGAPGYFISTLQFAGMLGAEDRGITDFIVGDA